jgi:hypothetical protein
MSSPRPDRAAGSHAIGVIGHCLQLGTLTPVPSDPLTACLMRSSGIRGAQLEATRPVLRRMPCRRQTSTKAAAPYCPAHLSGWKTMPLCHRVVCATETCVSCWFTKVLLR